MGCNDGEAKASPSKGCVVRPISCVGELDEEKLPDLLTLKYQRYMTPFRNSVMFRRSGKPSWVSSVISIRKAPKDPCYRL